MYIESGKDEKDLFLFTVVSEDDDCTCFNENISKQFFFPFKPLDCTKENGFRHFFRKAPPRELWFLLASCFLSVLEAAVMMLLISTSPCYTAAFLWSELKRNKHIKSKEFSISEAGHDPAVIRHAPRAQRNHHPRSIATSSCKQKGPEAGAILRVLHKYNISYFIKAWFGRGLH